MLHQGRGVSRRTGRRGGGPVIWNLFNALGAISSLKIALRVRNLGPGALSIPGVDAVLRGARRER